MKRLLIVYHSQTGQTEKLIEAAVQGAREEPEIEVALRRAADATLDDLLQSHALLLGTPENFGYMSGMVKDFFDRTYEGARGRVDQRAYAILVSAGNDGSGAAREIQRIARGYAFKLVAEPLIVRGEISDAARLASRELGATLAAGLSLGIF